MNAQITLGEACDIISGVSYKPTDLHPELNEFSIPLLRANNITDGELSFDNVHFVDRSRVAKSQILQTDDILVCASSGSKSSIGKAAQFNGSAPTTFGAFCKAIRPRHIQADYLFFFFQSDRYRNIIESACTGTNINNLNSKIIKNIFLNIPAPEIQIERAMVLRVVSMQIRKHSAILHNLGNLIKSRFIEMFGNPLTNTKGLPTKKLIDVVRMQRGYDLPKTSRDEAGDIPVYGANGVVGFHNEAKRSEPCIVTGRSGSLGEVRFVTGPCWPLNTTLFSIDTHQNNVVYLRYLLAFFHLERFTAGSGVPTLNRNLFHGEQIIDVPIEEQEEFADFANRADKLRFDVQRQVEKLETLKKSLMQEYFG